MPIHKPLHPGGIVEEVLIQGAGISPEIDTTVKECLFENLNANKAVFGGGKKEFFSENC